MIARVNESKGVQPLLQTDLSQINLRVHELSNEIVPSHQNKIIERYNVKITACIGDAWDPPYTLYLLAGYESARTTSELR